MADVKLNKTYQSEPEEVLAAIEKVALSLGGKVLSHDKVAQLLIIQMDKKMEGKVLGDRSKLEIKYSTPTGESTQVEVLAYPLNAVGQKLMFGARPGVVQTVLKTIFERVNAILQV